MEARPKRKGKKSSKLLTYELETIASNRKPYKKQPKTSEHAAKTIEPLVPKLTIKFGKGPEGESSNTVVTSHEAKTPGKPGRKRKKAPSTSEDEDPAPTSKKSRDTDDEPYFPTDVEVDIDEDSESNDDDADGSQPQSPIKRQRKLPAKFADGDFDTDADLSSNKAAKFFETKKAEQKAAAARAKQEASKAGKKKRNRMPTAYTMWCNSYRTKLQAQFPGMSFAAMNKKLGEVWWSIPLKEKNQWNRKAKRLATHGTPKTEDSLKYLGSKAIASLQRNNCLSEQATPVKEPTATAPKHITAQTNLTPVYKVTQTEPMDVAAYLSVMGDALVAMGDDLTSYNGKPAESTLTVLLDALLSGMSALMCLTQQVPELDEGIHPQTHRQRMTDVAHFMPNLL
ncbi:HMG domain-containing protein 4-like isoform X2 [Watersipora subatra]|uniref:HMG domain-containing protein 4-like isoform X2 n=1 Tax=Watersipora subatra TaxID=2589382 RepID=UPI00355BB740